MPRFARAVTLAAVVAVGIVVAVADASPDAVPPPTGAALEALSKPPTYTPFASQRVYFVMPDRYANGDPSNDRGGLTGGRSVTGFDPTDTGWYHGGDLKGLTGTCTDTRTGLARLTDLGFTAIWVTPAVVQQAVQADSAAYHGYWGRDFTSVDPHLGTNDDFAAFADCAHRLGMKVYLDVVVNHTADVVLLSGGTTFRGPDEAPFRDCKGRPFSAQRYAGGQALPLPLRPLPAAAGDRLRPEPRGEAPGVAERRRPLPQPRRHRLRELLARVLRAGRLLRPRRPLHRAAVRRLRPRSGVRGLDPPVQARRLPDRHGEARRSRVLPLVGAEDPRCGARGRRPRLRDLRRGDALGRRRARDLRPRARPSERHRLPAPGRARALRGRLGRLAGNREPACGRRLLPPGGRDSADAGDVPREPRRRPCRAADQAADRCERRRAARIASSSGTRCSTSCAAHRSCTTATRWG